MKIRLMGVDLFRADRQMDGQINKSSSYSLLEMLRKRLIRLQHNCVFFYRI